MTDEEKLRVIDEINKYVHNIANYTTAINYYTRNTILGPRKIELLKDEVKKIEIEGIKIRLNLVKIFLKEEEGDETNGKTGTTPN